MSEITERLTTAIADRYRIERELGAGGMATVYLAHDVKHDRKVALKVLRPELAAVIGAERFLQEIKVTANLQHPNILALYDSGEADTFLYYVMPYVEGDTLRDKLDREKQLAVDDAIEITKSVATALDYAHRHDVIHRDIKPENILIHDGQALVADFGIALAVSQAAGNRLTETGLSLGTPHYMSPEQAMGDRELDARSDVYSLGAMLYEMLAGDPPYTGSTAQAIVAKVITEKAPPVTAVRDTVPPHVAAAIQKALSKLPADRFHSAAEFAEALVKPGAVELPLPAAAEVAAGILQARKPRDWRLIGEVAVAVVLVGVALLGWLKPDGATPPSPARFVVNPPSGQGLANVGDRLASISPDGTLLVYVGTGEGGRTQLFRRQIDDLAVQPIPDTEGATGPFFSPDGEWIGFVQGNTVKKVAVAGGPALTIARFEGGAFGSHWGDDGRVIFVMPGGLGIVPGTGGNPERLPVPDTTADYRWPELLPDGRAALVTLFAGLEGAKIGVLDLESGQIDTIIIEGVHAHYLRTGHIVYGHASGALFAVPFDLGKREVTGQPTPVLESVRVFGGGATQFLVSDNGTAVYLEGGSDRGVHLAIVGMDGREELLAAEPRRYSAPRFSPDGRYISLLVSGERDDVHIYDAELGTLSRLSFQGRNSYPLWSRDGTFVIFTSERDGSSDLDIYRKPADGSGSAEALTALPLSQYAHGGGPDGRLLVRQRFGSTLDLYVLEPGADTLIPYLLTEAGEVTAQVSPDGRWAAYVSDETGANEVYVRAFPEAGGRWQISQGGGNEPVWSPDGRKIYYRNLDDFIAVIVRTAPTFQVVGRETLFTGRYAQWLWYANYDVHPDGDRFVMVKAGEIEEGITVVVNWFEELKARMGQ